jgi:hypothetical protein
MPFIHFSLDEARYPPVAGREVQARALRAGKPLLNPL